MRFGGSPVYMYGRWLDANPSGQLSRREGSTADVEFLRGYRAPPLQQGPGARGVLYQRTCHVVLEGLEGYI